LVKHADLHLGIALCILAELALFGSQGLAGMMAIAVAIAYSLLMYKEFFIREKIRPHLTTYAVSHTVVSGMLSLALISVMSREFPWALDQSAYLFALNSWCLFNIFEFGRKTFTTVEERPGVESYSKIFGRHGAVALVLSMAGASALCLVRIETVPVVKPFILASCGILLLAGTAYARLDRAPYGKIYRAFSSVYIVLIYSGLVAIRVWS
jgi:4-hydroxybenzoate polyprenyltransferase